MTKNTQIERLTQKAVDEITRRIIIVRGERVILDEDLAVLYGITTGNLNKAVKRNMGRFPPDFMFQLYNEEFEALKFQTGRSKLRGRGGRRTPPVAYTEHGALMAATVLRSDLAIKMSVYVVRAFVRLRELIRANPELSNQLYWLEQKYLSKKNQFAHLLDALTALLDSTHAKGQLAKESKKGARGRKQTYTLEFTKGNQQAVKFLEALGATLGEGVVTTDFEGEKR
jgi:hypothetical protein